MNQISSLKRLVHYQPEVTLNIPKYTSFPGANYCLIDLTELRFFSDSADSEIFYQLSQICRNIQILDIEFASVISNGIADLISAQQSLKHLYLFQWTTDISLPTDII